MSVERAASRRDELFDALMQHAISLLEKNGGFYPIAYVSHAIGAPRAYATVAPQEEPSVAEYRAELDRSLRQLIRSEEPPIELVGFAVDSVMTNPSTGVKGDAIFVHLEARGDTQATECFAYYRIVDGELAVDEPFAQRGEVRYFDGQALA